MRAHRIDRRQFVSDAAVVAASLTTLAIPPRMARAATPGAVDRSAIRNYNENMEYRRLGKTDLMISALSLGGHWKNLECRVGTGLFDQNRHDIVSACIDCGINYIDASTGREVLAYAKALQGRRDKVYLGFSWYEREMRFEGWQTAEKLLEGFEDGLKEAGLDNVDLWRITCHWKPDADHTPAHEEAIITALQKAKKDGKARLGGISTHKHDWAIRMIENYADDIDAILVPYTAGSKDAHMRVELGGPCGWKAVRDSEASYDKPIASLMDAVRKHRVGWFGIKPFASGSIFYGRGAVNEETRELDDERARQTLRYVLGNDALTATIPGMITVEQVRNAARAVTERRQLDAAETDRHETMVRQMWARLPRHYQWLRQWEWV